MRSIVRQERSVFRFLKLSHENRKRFSITLQRQHPDIVTGLWVDGRIQQKAPVPRPTGRSLVLIRFEKQSLLARSVSVLLIQVQVAVAVGRIRDAFSIRRPDGIAVPAAPKVTFALLPRARSSTQILEFPLCRSSCVTGHGFHPERSRIDVRTFFADVAQHLALRIELGELR